MSIKKQEEEVKLWTEACKALFTLFLTVSAGLLFISRTLFGKTDPSLKAFNSVILLFGIVFDIGVIFLLVVTLIKVIKIIKKL